MSAQLTHDYEFHVARERKGQKRVQEGRAKALPVPVGRIPRVAKLMALAIRLDGLVGSGQVESYVELARLGHVTPARITQIMNLLNLAPDIQEALLHLLPVERGRDPIKLRDLQGIAGVVEWRRQRRVWADASGLTKD